MEILHIDEDVTISYENGVVTAKVRPVFEEGEYVCVGTATRDKSRRHYTLAIAGRPAVQVATRAAAVRALRAAAAAREAQFTLAAVREAAQATAH